MPDQPAQHPTSWLATSATVTSCRYQSPALSLMAFGFSTRQKFRITFDYYAHGRLYSAEFHSPTAIPQNTSLAITYNPLDPQQNSRSATSSAAPSTANPPLFALGITGSILLSLAWLLILHSCR